jgi:uncharacterized membrane protein
VDPETKQLLTRSLQLAEENNQMLQKLYKAQRRAQIFQAVYWGLILLSIFGSYLFLSPYLSSLLNLYTGGASGNTSMQDVLKGLNPGQMQQEIKDLNK